MPLSPNYRQPARVAVAVQVFVLLGSGFTLDGGLLGQLCAMALVPFWAATLLLIWRRPRRPTRLDLAFIRIGYLPVVLLTSYLSELIWHYRGVL